ncbi:hypothetical protein PFISCL1PPCAC_14816, partial [Pristionchus fissidentatus]
QNHHSKCAFTHCRCSKCELWTNRSMLDEEMRRNNNRSSSSSAALPLKSQPSTSSVIDSLPSSSSSQTLSSLPSSSSPHCSISNPTIASLLSSSSSSPSVPVITTQFLVDETIPIIDASILPTGYLEACIATSQVEFINPTPVMINSFPLLFPFQ